MELLFGSLSFKKEQISEKTPNNDVHLWRKQRNCSLLDIHIFLTLQVCSYCYMLLLSQKIMIWKAVVFIKWLLLTRGSLPIVPWIYISFALSALGSWNFLHPVNLRNTQFRIKCKVHFPLLDCQVMMVPVPQLLKIVVIKHIEGIIPRDRFLKERY